MSTAILINVAGDGLQVPRRLLAALAPARLNPVIGRAGTNATVAHLRRLNSERPNALGGRRTNYYAGAARGTSFDVVSDTEVVISIAQIGIRQRVYGGIIRPRTAKFLTVPAIAEAHGKRAREFGDLKFAIIPRKGPALVRVKRLAAKVATGKRQGRGAISAGVSSVPTSDGGSEVEVVFWLRRSVTQKPDPSVLPSTETLGAAIKPAVESHVARALRRGASPATP